MSFIHVYLVELLNHLLNADVSVLGDFALHAGEPLTELLILFVEYSPLIQLLGYLLPAQRQLSTTAINLLTNCNQLHIRMTKKK